MSHHILQQFDERLLAEISGGDASDASSDRERLCASTARSSSSSSSERQSQSWLTLSWPRQWLVLAAALVVAALALLIAINAERRADDLQRRLAAHERASDR